jgi:MFS family permease
VADTLFLLLAAQIVGGLGFLLVIVSSQAYVGQITETKQRERGFAVFSFTAAIGQALGPLGGGFLLAQFGFDAAFGVSLLLAVSGFCMIGLRDSGRRAHLSAAPLPERISQFRRYLSDRAMVVTLLFTFMVVFTVSLRSSFIPVLFKEKGFDESSIGLLLTVSACSMTSIRFIVGWLMGRFSRTSLAAWAMGCVCVAVALVPANDVIWAMGALMVIFGFGFGISQPLSMVMVSDRASSGSMGLAMGVRFTTVMAAALLGPLVIGLVAELYGIAAGCYFAAAMLFLTGLWVVKALGRRS